jgi:23S rRNA pseudouridine1911/1915/1917 synthase
MSNLPETATILQVEGDSEGMRLDLYLAKMIPKFSRSFHKNLITTEQVYINDAVEFHPQYRVKSGDRIEIKIPPQPDQYVIKPVKIDFKIIFENSELLVIDKPAEMVVHPGSGHFNDTLANAVKYYLADKSEDQFGPERAGQVHRLDKPTSGIILFAKSPTSLWFLSKQFADRMVYKTYIATVRGECPVKFMSDKAIGRDKLNRQKFSSRSEKTRLAQTEFRRLYTNGKYSVVICKPRTGRTHQIRVHLSEAGYPIVGDIKYGGGKADRMLLHAYKLSLYISPDDVDMKEFTAPLPGDFKQVLTQLNCDPAQIEKQLLL